MKQVLFFFIFLIAITSCKQRAVNKPKGYFTIQLPQKQYQTFNVAGYPYSFEYPIYAKVVKDSTFFGKATENPWWINVDFPTFKGRIYISYKPIGSNKLDTLLRHAFRLTNAHDVKATQKEDSLMQTPNNVGGLMFKLGGEVATANQFLLTDSTKHFLRGALYFDATPNEDSLLPINNFLMQDLKHLINTFKWKNN
jgi:gliding motility-associated lipoprotein GldD